MASPLFLLPMAYRAGQTLRDVLAQRYPEHWGGGTNPASNTPAVEYKGAAVDTLPDYARVPQWASSAFDDPTVFNRWYNSVRGSENLPAIMATLGSAAKAESDTQRGQEQSLGTLRDLLQSLQGELDTFRSDPRRQQVAETLQEQATPGYRAITETEEGAWRNRIAQSAARQEALRLGTAGARGTAGSGTTLQDVTAQRAIADAQGVNLSANVAAANREAVSRALSDLGSYTDRGAAIEQQMLNRLAQIESAIAQVEGGTVYEPTDFLSLAELDFGQEQYLAEQQARNDALDALIESNQFGGQDFVDFLTSLSGTGIPSWLGSVLG